MTTLRETAQQALEVLERAGEELRWQAIGQVQRDLRAALAQEQAERVQETDLSRCPQCNGPADNGHDRSIPPNPYFCTRCMAEPPQRKPLTEKEIGHICDAQTLDDAMQQPRAMAQAYENGYKAGAAAEREACAKLAESTICDTHLPTGVRIYGTRAADAIRTRSNT